MPRRTRQRAECWGREAAGVRHHPCAPLAAIRTQLQQVDVVHCDESGLRVEGKLRELQFITERYEQPWAAEMAKLLLDGKTEVANTPPEAGGLSAERLADYHQAYDRLVQAGHEANPPLDSPPTSKRGRKRRTPPQNLLGCLEKNKALILCYLEDFRVPFDNNLAERDVWMVKVKQKVSGTFRTTHGAMVFCDIRSYLSTARKQAHRGIQVLHSALLGRPFVPA